MCNKINTSSKPHGAKVHCRPRLISQGPYTLPFYIAVIMSDPTHGSAPSVKVEVVWEGFDKENHTTKFFILSSNSKVEEPLLMRRAMVEQFRPKLFTEKLKSPVIKEVSSVESCHQDAESQKPRPAILDKCGYSDLESSDDESLDYTPHTSGGESGGSSYDEMTMLPFATAFDTEIVIHPSYPFLSLELQAVNKLVQLYQEHSNNTNKPGDTPGTAQAGNMATETSSKRSFQSRTNMKRSLSNAQLQSETGDSRPITKKGRKRIDDGQPRLACPFQKRDPEKYVPACGWRERGFLTISHVKQHLKRNHRRNPNYCPRCMHIFATEGLKNEHIMQLIENPCPKSNAALPAGIDPETLKALTTRAENGSDIREQWFSLWEMIFPNIPRPATHTYDLSEGLNSQVRELAAYYETEGPRIALSVLTENGISVSPPESAQHEIELYIRRSISQAFQQIYQSWLSQRPQTEPNQTLGNGISVAASHTEAPDEMVGLATPNSNGSHLSPNLSQPIRPIVSSDDVPLAGVIHSEDFPLGGLEFNAPENDYSGIDLNDIDTMVEEINQFMPGNNWNGRWSSSSSGADKYGPYSMI